jgi:methionine sulfoxide reductase heme-binding subunit
MRHHRGRLAEGDAVTSGTTLWYLTRGSGAVSLLLLTATTLLGVLTAGRWRSERWPRFAVTVLHRNLTLLAIVFIGIHVGTTIADGYAPIGVKDVFIPFVSQYRPIWLGLGALAFDLLLALTITSLLRKHIGYRMWRLLHWAAYATWPLALAHGFGSGSDARQGWMAALAFGSLALVVLAITVRLFQSGNPALQLVAGGATVAVLLLLAAWYKGGPAKRGWAARAGTPVSLLKSTRAESTGTRSLAGSSVPRPPRPFSGRLVGRLSSSGPDFDGNAAIAIATAIRGGEPGVVRLTLWGIALQGGGLEMADSQVSFEDVGRGIVFSGRVVALDGNLVVADVTSPSGSTLRLRMLLQLDSGTRSVTGKISAASAEEGAEQ